MTGAKLAPTLLLLFMVTVQVVLVPEHAPDHPVKAEFVAGVAVRVTTVPELKVEPLGLLVIVPVPVPDFVVVRVYVWVPPWVTVKACPAIVEPHVLEVVPELLDTE